MGEELFIHKDSRTRQGSEGPSNPSTVSMATASQTPARGQHDREWSGNEPLTYAHTSGPLSHTSGQTPTQTSPSQRSPVPGLYGARTAEDRPFLTPPSHDE